MLPNDSIVSTNILPKYIEMCSRNINLRIDSPVGNNNIMIFDIDNCLYYSKEMDILEFNNAKSKFLSHQETNEAMWDDCIRKIPLFRKIFYDLFNIHPRDYELSTQIDYSKYVFRDCELRRILTSFPCRKFCFTNAPRMRAESILKLIGIEDVFEHVICADIHDTEFITKPDFLSYKFIERFLGVELQSNDDNIKKINIIF